jgi:hypothetical protein
MGWRGEYRDVAEAGVGRPNSSFGTAAVDTVRFQLRAQNLYCTRPLADEFFDVSIGGDDDVAGAESSHNWWQVFRAGDFVLDEFAELCRSVFILCGRNPNQA